MSLLNIQRRFTETKQNIDKTFNNKKKNTNAPIIENWDALLSQHNWHSVKYKKLRKQFLQRAGIPVHCRGEIWLEMSQANKQRDINYQNLFTSFKDLSSEYTEQIEKDLKRTFANVKLFETEEGIETLRRVLVTYSWCNPEIGYCQSMNFICAVFLLFMEEEDAFWLMKTTLEKILPKEYYTTGMIGVRSDERVLRELISLKLPKISLHFQRLNIDIKGIVAGWYMSLFVNVLPLDATFRVLDNMFCNGSQILHKIFIALLIIHKKEILKIETMGELFGYLLQIPHYTDTEMLFKVLNNKDVMGPFSSSYISSLREKHWKDIKLDYINVMECDIKIVNPSIPPITITQSDVSTEKVTPSSPISGGKTFMTGTHRIKQPVECILTQSMMPSGGRDFTLSPTHGQNNRAPKNYSRSISDTGLRKSNPAAQQNVNNNKINSNEGIPSHIEELEQKIKDRKFPPPPTYVAPPVPVRGVRSDVPITSPVPNIVISVNDNNSSYNNKRNYNNYNNNNNTRNNNNNNNNSDNYLQNNGRNRQAIKYDELIDAKYAKRFKQISAIFQVKFE